MEERRGGKRREFFLKKKHKEMFRGGSNKRDDWVIDLHGLRRCRPVQCLLGDRHFG